MPTSHRGLRKLLTKKAMVEVDRPFKAFDNEGCMLYAVNLYLLCAQQQV